MGTYFIFPLLLHNTVAHRSSGSWLDSIFDDLKYFRIVRSYVDGILLFSWSHKEDTTHLRMVFQLLPENDFVARPDMCVFGVDDKLSSSGVTALKSKSRRYSASSSSYVWQIPSGVYIDFELFSSLYNQ